MGSAVLPFGALWTMPAKVARRRALAESLSFFSGDRLMRIAQIAPLYESCPPKLYGGTERIVSYLTEELVRQSHDVTLFASGDSVTPPRLFAPCERAIRPNPHFLDPPPMP